MILEFTSTSLTVSVSRGVKKKRKKINKEEDRNARYFLFEK